ncbi:pyridoxal phosphate-dependent aminotransferase [Streptomyces sp. HNM0663]|uniref:cysteine-S-conjugate beta-lyase n=1 Tax=Streptomyces chengmaiensis TaxID=3040919 RepID=A0ABT6HHQ7_9ACTN|nr:pyridoxal phosphate-dependent aminotransferase [Streptomyces chengmaiensis]MDH2387827.1 pyridoxal phosphate-dependent aminotransferase [Streptomyces chengmaiensis]
MEHDFGFDAPVDRRGTWSVQWDGVADRFGAAGLLPFTISDMDFAAPPAVLRALHERIAHGVFGYTDWRLGGFRDAVRHWHATRYGTEVDPEQIVYAPSVLSQLSQLLQMWTAPGDGVVVHTPVYDGFRKAVDGLGRELLGAPVGDMRQLERQLARPQAKALILCSPHNPTGRVWTEHELAETAKLAEAYGVAVISDEIHADLVHEGRRHIPWTRFAGGDRPGAGAGVGVGVQGGRWALITSGSKAFNFPALNGSYGIIADPDERTAFVRRMETGEGLASPSVLSLTAHIAAYRESAPWLNALRGYVAGNLAMAADRLNGAFPALDWSPPQAGYLAWIDLRPLGVEDEELQRELIQRERVAIMRGAVYGCEGFVRLNLGCPRAKAERGVDALVRAVRRLAG